VPDAELAYLSACETATGSPLLADESVHLAAAMLLLGYRHVVGTLWSVHDATAPLIAGAFYETLPTGRDVTPLPAARALHDAVARLRAHRPADPLLWAPYLHIGA
jgi:CHAT domain-containing protein